MAVTFSAEDVDFELNSPEVVRKWISRVVENHNCRVGKISYRFCSDNYILDVNRRYLNHDTYTDIITFDYVVSDMISGDILISVDRVGENASVFNVPFQQELCRVIIHGVLHLLGFKDKSDEDASTMRMKENESLMLLQGIQ